MSEEQPVVFVIDDDPSVRDALAGLLRSVGLDVRSFGSTQEFLQSKRPERARLPCAGCQIAGAQRAGLPAGAGRVGHSASDRVHHRPRRHSHVRAGNQGRSHRVPDQNRSTIRSCSTRSSWGSRGIVPDAAMPRPSRDLKAALRLIDAARTRDHGARRHRRRMTSKTDRTGDPVGVSDIDVKVHRGQVMRKMRAKSLAELVRMADQLGVTGGEFRGVFKP